jgi:hypothetical protein
MFNRCGRFVRRSLRLLARGCARLIAALRPSYGSPYLVTIPPEVLHRIRHHLAGTTPGAQTRSDFCKLNGGKNVCEKILVRL